MTIDELRREALALDAPDRAGLAHDLLASLDALTEAEIENLWLDEAVRRDAELASGEAKAIPMDEVFAQARARLG